MKFANLFKPQKTDAIKCPYCFKPFSNEDVCFLVPAAKPRTSLRTDTSTVQRVAVDAFDEYEQHDEDAEEKQETPNESNTIIDEQSNDASDSSLESLFRKRESDPKLEAFWRDIGGKEAYEKNAAFGNGIEWNSPLVTPENKGEMTTRGYETDSDGFVNRVHDKLSGKESYVRLCPHCHNVLPKQYGKYPVKFFSVVGVTSAGKTVYLNQLLGSMNRYLQQIGLTLLYPDEAAEELRSITSEDDVLPMATYADSLRPPLSFAVMDQAAQRYYTLVFYDIAGENCVRADRMRSYGPYIEHADGILMLIDPVQFPQLAAEIRIMNPGAATGGTVAYATDVLKAMYENFLLQNVDRKQRVLTPIAFTISKSDLLDPIIRQDPYYNGAFMLKPNVTVKYSTRKKRNMVDFGSISQVSGEILYLLSSRGENGFCEAVNKNFSHRQLFATSALGCRTHRVLSNKEPLVGNYIGATENEANRSKVVIHLTEENRRVLDAVEDKGGGLLCFDLREATLTEVEETPDWSKTARGKFYFSVDSTRGTLYQEYYYSQQENRAKGGAMLERAQAPVSRPNPRRVEEPLFWLLADMGLVPMDDKG